MNREENAKAAVNGIVDLPILVDEYASKVERFVGLWREELISGIELVNAINDLGKHVVIIENNFIHVPEIAYRQRLIEDDGN